MNTFHLSPPFHPSSLLSFFHHHSKTIIHLIMGALVCPEDRSLWFRGMVQGMFSTLKETYSQLIKV